MKSCEKFVSPKSEYYVYSPSLNGQSMFFYPLCTGRFIYEGGYYLRRDSYDSFLLMYIKSGSLTLEYAGGTIPVPSDRFVLLDCYQPHSYYSETGWESVWCHFDGPVARAFYQNAVSRLGNVFSLTDPYPAVRKLTAVFNLFHEKKIIHEALVSKYLTDILTGFLLYSPAKISAADASASTEKVISYIHEHFSEGIRNEKLAALAGLSPCHFIRVFKRETGFTPHEYIVNVRLNTAKYLLKNSGLSVKSICFESGFFRESIFCSAFKKKLGMTPAQYRGLDSASQAEES